MPIIVGTMIVKVTPTCSITSMTAPGSNIGTNVVTAPEAGIDRMAPSEAAWNIGVWCSHTCVGSMPQVDASL